MIASNVIGRHTSLMTPESYPPGAANTYINKYAFQYDAYRLLKWPHLPRPYLYSHPHSVHTLCQQPPVNTTHLSRPPFHTTTFPYLHVNTPCPHLPRPYPHLSTPLTTHNLSTSPPVHICLHPYPHIQCL